MRRTVIALVALLAAPAGADEDAKRTPSSQSPVANLPQIAPPEAGSGIALRTDTDGAHEMRLVVDAAVTARLRVTAGGSFDATTPEGRGFVGLRYQLTTERAQGVATFAGMRWPASGHEGRPELVFTFAVQKHVASMWLSTEIVYAQETAEAQRDAGIALVALRSISRRAWAGLAGHLTIDLDEGRDDGGEVRWEASGGATISVATGGAALTVQAGPTAFATPNAMLTGGFVLAAIGGWF